CGQHNRCNVELHPAGDKWSATSFQADCCFTKTKVAFRAEPTSGFNRDITIPVSPMMRVSGPSSSSTGNCCTGWLGSDGTRRSFAKTSPAGVVAMKCSSIEAFSSAREPALMFFNQFLTASVKVSDALCGKAGTTNSNRPTATRKADVNIAK